MPVKFVPDIVPPCTITIGSACVKANSNRAILHLLAREGAGFDIVSGGELFRVLAAGGDPTKCTFAGVGKSREEIEYALEHHVHSFNVESEAELEYIDRIAASKGVRAPIALRVNPDVEAHTHKYVSTGRSENKFGIALDRLAAVYEHAAQMPNITIRGVQMHIGSQITEAQPFTEAIAKDRADCARAEGALRDRILQRRWRHGHRLRSGHWKAARENGGTNKAAKTPLSAWPIMPLRLSRRCVRSACACCSSPADSWSETPASC